MSQNDFTIANQTFPNTRADINSALQALASNNSGTSAPSTQFANQFWYNSTTNILYIRNEGNDADIPIMELDQTNDTVEYFKSDSVRTALIEFTDGDDALAIADGGALTVSTSLDMNGTELILDADADTSITVDTDDRIDFKVGGTDRAYLTTNHVGAIINRQNALPLFINGDMNITQRATSKTGITGTTLEVQDRFACVMGGAGTWTNTSDTDNPGGRFAKSNKWDCTATGSMEAGSVFAIRYIFEGQDLQLLKYGSGVAEKVTLAFWLKSPVTGTHIASLYQFDDNRQVSKAYTVSSADTWQKVVLDFPADTTGVIDNDNGAGMGIELAFRAGTNYSSGTLNTSWASYTAANQYVGQVDACASTSNNILLTGFQLEVGEYTSATLPYFQHESFGDSLARCQRYYQKSYTQGVFAGESSSLGIKITTGTNDGGGVAYNWQGLKCDMRAAPSVVAYTTAGVINRWTGASTSVGVGDKVATAASIGTAGFHMAISIGGASNVSQCYGHWVCSAEI